MEPGHGLAAGSSPEVDERGALGRREDRRVTGTYRCHSDREVLHSWKSRSPAWPVSRYPVRSCAVVSTTVLPVGPP